MNLNPVVLQHAQLHAAASLSVSRRFQGYCFKCTVQEPRFEETSTHIFSNYKFAPARRGQPVSPGGFEVSATMCRFRKCSLTVVFKLRPQNCSFPILLDSTFSKVCSCSLLSNYAVAASPYEIDSCVQYYAVAASQYYAQSTY